MIILRSPKGWTGPASEHGKQLLNNFASHQVPLPDVRTDSGALEYLDKWLHSYDSEKFFDFSEANLKRGTIFAPLLDEALPKDNERRLGFIKESYNAYKPLDLADWKGFGYEKDEDVRSVSPLATTLLLVPQCSDPVHRARDTYSCMKAIGKYLTDVVKRNPKSFRMFSPDELASNKLDAVLDATTRCFQPDPTTAHIGGRVTEMLSEHTLQGWLQGYTMTGRHGVFPSYEAFLGIVATMMVQYSASRTTLYHCSCDRH